MMTALPELPDLPRDLFRLVRQIPAGKITTYGALAMALGDRLASRWVGHFLLHHEHEADCPCPRVVRADGTLGGYVGGDVAAKARRLRAEGVRVVADRVDRERYEFRNFDARVPLHALREAQREAETLSNLTPPRGLPITVAGLDVSYQAPDRAVGAYVLCDFKSGERLWAATVECEAAFPYIPSYLTFRELPVLARLFEIASAENRLADAYLVDGSGRAHPRRFGVACHLGVTIDRPTIGVTKKLLTGRVDTKGLSLGESRPIADGDEILGAALRACATSEQVLYVSPGNRVDVRYAQRVVSRVLLGRRLPEPLYWADRLSRATARGRRNIEATIHA